MKCTILHETRGRMRVRLCCRRMTLEQADVLEYYLLAVDGVQSVKVYDRTRDAVVVYAGRRSELIRVLGAFSFAKAAEMDLVPEHTARALNREFEDKLAVTVMRRCISRLFLPVPVTTAISLFRSVKYIKEGCKALLQGRLSVAVLDAAAVTVSMVRGDFATAGSVMFMLRLGEILEEWTHKKSVADLASAMSLRVDSVWQQVNGTEVLTKITDVKPGDRIVIRTGGMIPLDGRVVEGEAMVNQSSLTGESMPVAKRPGSPIYAGTVVEEGECVISVEKSSGGGRYDRVVRMIEESEKLKSTAEDKASRMADRLVPYTLGGTALTYLLTRNVTKMLSVLMVDFSCAPEAIHPHCGAVRHAGEQRLSHLRQGRTLFGVGGQGRHHCVRQDRHTDLCDAHRGGGHPLRRSRRGGNAAPCCLSGGALPPFHGKRRGGGGKAAQAHPRGVSFAGAVCGGPRYLQHGGGQKVIIGSAHFVFEDEGCRIPEGEQAKFDTLPAAYSHLYLCIDGELAAVICIHDPLRREAREAVRALHESGFTNVVMMTGDNRRTAEAVAAEVGVDAVYAEVLPEDKAAFIRQEKAKGHTVIMVGDGVNDSPALSEADAGIAISTGAAIAREIADITVASEDLFSLVTLRRLGEALMERIHGSYRFIVGFNLTLIALGVAGILPPTTSALLHNGSTLGISLRNMTDLLKKKITTHNAAKSNREAPA